MVQKPAKSRRRRKYDSASSRRIPPQVDPNGQEARKHMTKVDFTGVSAGFEPVEPGQYPIIFTAGTVKDSKATPGAKYIGAELTVSDEDEAKGRKFFLNWSLQPKALWRMKQDAVTFGIEPETLEGEVDIDELLEELQGREAVAEVSVEEYTANDGKTKQRNTVLALHESAIGGR